MPDPTLSRGEVSAASRLANLRYSQGDVARRVIQRILNPDFLLLNGKL